MNTRLHNPMKPTEWACIAAGLFLAGVIYMGTIHSSLRLFAELETTRAEKQQVEKELAETREYQHKLIEETERLETKLSEIGGSPPTEKEKDALIARLTLLASAGGITIDRYTPLDTVIEDDHRAFFVQFTGRGSYTALKDYFQRVENDMDFVDITHFSVSADKRDPTSECELNWSCRINGMRLDTIPNQGNSPLLLNTAAMELRQNES